MSEIVTELLECGDELPALGPTGPSGWVVARFWTGLVAGFVLVIAATLVALAIVPTVVGITGATVVGSGSMSPALRTGDVVLLEEPVRGGRGLRPPSVILIDRGEQVPLLHRITGLAPQASGYVTQGDANAEPDSEPARYAAVRGVGRVVIPAVGTPLLWLGEADLAPLAAVIAVVAAMGALARYGWSARLDPWPALPVDDDDGPPTGPEPEPALEPVSGSVAGPRGDPRHATGRRALLPSIIGGARGDRGGSSTRQRRGLVGLVVVAALVGGGALRGQVPVAAAVFTATTTNAANTLVAATLAAPTTVAATSRCVSAAAPRVAGGGVFTGIGDIVVTIPSGVQAGDLLVAHIVDSAQRGDPGGGARLLDTVAPNADGTGTAVHSTLWQRRALATDAGKTFTWPGSSTTQATIAVGVFRGARAVIAPTDAGGAGSSTGNTSTAPERTAPERTAAQANSLLVTFHAAAMKAGFSTPAGMTEAHDTAASLPGPLSLAGFTQELTAPGPTGTKTSTMGAPAPSTAQSVVIEPAAAPAAALVDVTWTPSASDFATGYQVLRDGVVVATLTSRTTSTWTDTDPGAGERRYAVRATAGSWTSTDASAPAITATC